MSTMSPATCKISSAARAFFLSVLLSTFLKLQCRPQNQSVNTSHTFISCDYAHSSSNSHRKSILSPPLPNSCQFFLGGIQRKKTFSEKRWRKSPVVNIRFDRRKISGKQEGCDSVSFVFKQYPAKRLLAHPISPLPIWSPSSFSHPKCLSCSACV